MENKKLSLKSIIGYGIGGAGIQFSWALISNYLTVFYTDVVGLAPAVISVIMLGARIWDAVNDPMFGNIAENHTHTRWGRYRPYLLFGAPILAIFNCLTFLCLDLSTTAKVVWCAFTYIFCGMIYTAVGISVNSLPNCITTVNKERVSLQSANNIIGNMASLLINAISMPLILFFGSGSTSSPKGYFMAALIFSIVCVPCIWICFASNKENVKVEKSHAVTGNSVKKTGFLSSIKQIFTDHDTCLLIISMIFCLIAIMGRMGIMAYYFIYVLDNPASMAACASALSIGMIMPGFYVPFLLNRFDKKIVGAVGNFAQGLCCVALYFAAEAHAPLIILIVIHFIFGFVNTQQLACFTLAGEIIDDNWIRTGHRTDGMIFSCISFATKLGNAIGGSIGILALAAVGFVANTKMSTSVLSNMNKVINFGPFIFFVLAGVTFAMIHMTNEKGRENEKKVEAMQMKEQ